MPLNKTESFRIYEVGTGSGVKAVFNTAEDSIHQYSRVQTQRADDARKQIDQKGKSAAEDKEDIEVTISEDLADGHSANLDASLKLLSEDDPKLLLPSDQLEDDEIHIVQTTNVAPQDGNHAPQNYQMQLMLLEQQNKKRLLMERQERDNVFKFAQFDHLASTREYERRIRRQAIYKEHLYSTGADKPTLDLRAGHVRNKMPTNSTRKDAASVTKRQKRNARSKPQPGQPNHPNSANGEMLNKADVGSSEHDSINHPIPAFRDMPIPDANFDAPPLSPNSYVSGHLNGRLPVFDIEALMGDDTDDTAFIIIRTVECSQASVSIAQAGGLLRWTEDIFMKSQVSKKALQQIATCYFQPVQKNQDSGYDSGSTSKTPLLQNQIVPADLFLFHHREALEKYVADHVDSKQHISAVLDYTRYRFGSEFADADSLFANGLVTQAHVLHLFKPNELVICGAYGRPAAFVLQQWPEMDRDGWVTLRSYLNIDQEPSKISFLLMSPDIHGFYLNEKKWIQLFVDSVHPVTWNKKAYERLVLPPRTKDLVRALVTVRTSQRGVKQGLGVAGKRTDITSGKGNGLIMLLHGGPGTGKTLTGESVAEIAEMPLYRVTCGDIGTSAESVEKYLNAVLHLGKTWNCVLLLDEADIFLEERSMADFKRNSLVSVFLRILEYYDRILILTSNRVGMFDEAFKSRIQVALHYEKLNRSARRQIWQNFLDMLEEDEENVNFEEIKLHLDDLTERDLNGRQIRNVLTTARQLAIFRNERLDWGHLDQALSVSADFNKYLDRLQSNIDEQRAIDIGLR
ncbi:MAG: hypothetical protein Q9167_003982 [Letrouitia subvulpina]